MIWDALCNIIKIITAQTEFLYISCILIVIYDVRTGPYLTDCNSLRDCRVSRDIPSKDLWNASFKPLAVQLCERYQSFSSLKFFYFDNFLHTVSEAEMRK